MTATEETGSGRAAQHRIIAASALEALTAKHLQRLTFLVAAAFFMENLDGTIITTAVPAIAQTFGTSALDLNIGVSAYLIALGILIPASGWVADRYGTRRVFAGAIVMFTLASDVQRLIAKGPRGVFCRSRPWTVHALGVDLRLRFARAPGPVCGAQTGRSPQRR